MKWFFIPLKNDFWSLRRDYRLVKKTRCVGLFPACVHSSKHRNTYLPNPFVYTKRLSSCKKEKHTLFIMCIFFVFIRNMMKTRKIHIMKREESFLSCVRPQQQIFKQTFKLNPPHPVEEKKSLFFFCALLAGVCLSRSWVLGGLVWRLVRTQVWERVSFCEIRCVCCSVLQCVL